MANRIAVDTELLQQMSSQISQLQHSLSSIGDKVTSSVSEVRRVASGQDEIIRKLGNLQRSIHQTAERAGKLARATDQAANRWEEVEKQIGQQQFGQGDVGSVIGQSAIGTILKDFFGINTSGNNDSGKSKDQIISDYEKSHPRWGKEIYMRLTL